jgi:YfiH family protein
MIYLNENTGLFTSSFIPIEHGFGTKKFGDGRSKSAIISQTHSTNILLLKEFPVSAIPNYDGIITQLSKVTLSVITADCVPIIFYDTKNHIIGISHQGWKGTLEKLSEKMISALMNLGAKVPDIKVVIGPAINECCYEVSKDLADKFNNDFDNQTVTNRDNKYYINLIKANYISLLTQGILPISIDYFPFCTSCNKTLFWSNRRDKGIQGEMLSFISLKDM